MRCSKHRTLNCPHSECGRERDRRAAATSTDTTTDTAFQSAYVDLGVPDYGSSSSSCDSGSSSGSSDSGSSGSCD